MRFKHVKYFMREKLYFKQHYFCINKDEGKKKLFEAEKEATIQHKIQLGCNDKSFIRRLCLVINRGHDEEKKFTHFKAQIGICRSCYLFSFFRLLCSCLIFFNLF